MAMVAVAKIEGRLASLSSLVLVKDWEVSWQGRRLGDWV
jgi:hypothetical protein